MAPTSRKDRDNKNMHCRMWWHFMPQNQGDGFFSLGSTRALRTVSLQSLTRHVLVGRHLGTVRVGEERENSDVCWKGRVLWSCVCVCLTVIACMFSILSTIEIMLQNLVSSRHRVIFFFFFFSLLSFPEIIGEGSSYVHGVGGHEECFTVRDFWMTRFEVPLRNCLSRPGVSLFLDGKSRDP